jgi:hypothetical protein
MLYEQADWKWDAPQCHAYIRSMYSGLLNTLLLENSFNDLRDLEARVAKNDQLSAHQRQASCIRSIVRRASNLPQVQLDAADFGEKVGEGFSVKDETFRIKANSSISCDDAGVRVESLIDRKKDFRKQNGTS